MTADSPEVLSEDRWSDHAARQRDAQAKFQEINTYPGPGSQYVYYDGGVVGFVFGEMWPRPGLTKKERRWITLVCVGQADTPAPIVSHVYAAINSGDCTVEEVDEFNFFYASQLGWPKGQAISDGLIKAQQRLQDEQGIEYTFPTIVPWGGPSAGAQRRANGKRAYEQVMCEPAPTGSTPFRGIAYLDYLYGEHWTRPLLSIKERRIIAICCAAAMNADRELAKHIRAAFVSGDITKAQMDEVVFHHAVYAGWLNGSMLDDAVNEQWERFGTEQVAGDKS